MGFYRLLKNNFWLLGILLFALFLFTYHLSSIPSGVYVDEAVVGYDAFSILKTSRDHYGQFLPIYFKFFDSFTPGLFVYIQTIFIGLLGLNTFAIRLVSALSMLAVALAIYVFLKNEKILNLKYSNLLGMAIFILSPWTVFNARLGYETTLAFALLSVGILLYKRPLLSFLLISLSTYAGYTQRYLAPLVLLIIYFVFYFRKQPLKKVLLPFFWALVVQIPNIIFMFSPAFWVKNSSLTNSFISQYISYFSPTNLFSNQDYDLQRQIPEMAVFYGWMFIPWIAGLYTLYLNRKKSIYVYIICLIIIMPLPAALANTNYSTQRALPLLLPYSIVMALGIDKILQKISKWKRFIIMTLLAIFSLVLLWRSYFILFPVERASSWNYGYDQIAELIQSNPTKHFLVDNSRGLPDILILYWLKYPPDIYQRENPLLENYFESRDNKNVSFSNIEFRPIDWPTDLCKQQTLIGDGLAISQDQIEEHSLKKIFEIKDNRHQITLQAVETNPTPKCTLLK